MKQNNLTYLKLKQIRKIS